MDAKVINAYVTSTTNAVQTMANVKFNARQKPHLKKEGAPLCDVSATIGITGSYMGAITVNFDKIIACAIASNMLGEKHEELDDNVLDAIGEIANMVAGGAKAEGLNYRISIPTISSGKTISHHFSPGSPTVVIPFDTEIGDFTLEVCLKECDESQD